MDVTNRILKKIKVDKQEYAIVEYGIHQLMLILLNILTVITCGVAWGELIYALLFFGCFVVLRPYVGGYHANTELRCYGLSVMVLNLMMGCKHNVNIPISLYALAWIMSLIIILMYAPVENANKLLDEIEVEVYRKRSRKICFALSVIAFWGVVCDIEVIYSSVISVLILCAVLVIAGKMKY